MDRDRGYRHNYTLLPGTESTVPQPVMQMRPEMTGGILSPPVRSLPQSKSSKKLNSCSRCSWKAVSYGLAVILLFALAVICYLLFALLSDSPETRSYCGGRKLIEGSSELMISPQRPLPESFALGDPVVADLPSGILTYTYFALQKSSNVQFNLSIPSNGKLVLYGRQTLPPTPSEHDFVEIIIGNKLHSKAERTRRSIDFTPKSILRSTVLVHYLLAGKWQLGFLNDGRDMEMVEFSASLVAAREDDCKYGCYGKGTCKDGKCYCQEKYTGPYCEESICPAYCGYGHFSGGLCICEPGWKGEECDVRSSDCLVPDCNQHGVCGAQGTCLCDNGWTGEFCETRACVRPNCSNNGVCHEGECFCRFGWKGDGCETPFDLNAMCPGNSYCSNHGTWNRFQDRCECDTGWDGKECEHRLCSVDCGSHGHCVDSTCQCDLGWTGEGCTEKECSPGCYEHGSCNPDGTCKCERGWNGENCQLVGCPNGCNKHGECRKFGKNWRCACLSGYGGKGCSVPLELECSDNIDNDNDGLTDCEDSECCAYGSCRNNALCQTVPNPYTVLLGEQPPSSQASFYQKIKFLLQPKSVQQYADTRVINARVSVIRGRVKSSSGGSLSAVRVTDVGNTMSGFTLTRGGGMFDLVVNGGGSVVLQFLRRPFEQRKVKISAPWNSVVRIDDVIMYTKEEEIPVAPLFSSYSKQCTSLQMRTHLEPKFFPSWSTAKFGGPLGRIESGVLMADSQAVYENLLIPGTGGLHLTYFSANAPGYESTLKLLLVPGEVPEGLRTIFIEVRIEGNSFQKTLEASPNLTFTYGWEKRNVYKQKVYGLTTATVKVGYKFHGCDKLIWKNSEVKMNGYASRKADVGGWNLENHHHYNVRDGVLERGDGSFLYLKEEAPIMTTVIGNGQQRPADCPFCGGMASSRSLFQPTAIATSPDGSIYIGDHDLIRKISNDGTVATVLELKPSDTAHQYYLEVHPSSGILYISLPYRRQVVRVKSVEPEKVMNLGENLEVAVGTGQQCVIGENCGDEGPAISARLTFPKGIAFDTDGSLFIADGRKIRVVSPQGQMRSVLAGESPWRPLPCRVNFRPSEISFVWPTEIKIDRMNHHLLIMDSDKIFRMESMDIVRLIIGAPAHCASIQNENNQTVSPTRLSDSTAMAVEDGGNVYVAESDGKQIHRIKLYQSGEPTKLIAGRESKCKCHLQHCPCDSKESQLARDAHLFNPTALSIGPDGTIYVSDQGNLKIRAISPSLPSWDPETREYRIYAPDSDHTFHFNQFGQHTATTSLLSGLPLYNFTYHIDTAYGKLIEVTVGGLHKLNLIRKSNGAVQLSTSQGVTSTAMLSLGEPIMLETFERPDGSISTIDYDANSGLLVSRHDGQSESRFYDYDYEGHSYKVITKTGNIFLIKEESSADGSVLAVNSSSGYATVYRTGTSDLDKIDTSPKKYMFLNGGRTVREDFDEGWGIQWERSTHSLLQPHQTTMLKMKLKIPSAERPKRDELTSRMEWRYYLRRATVPGSRTKKIVQVGRKTRVNGVNVLTIEYDRLSKIDTVSNVNGDPILRVHYSLTGEVKRWEPINVALAAAEFEFTIDGRIASTQWEADQEHYFYDDFGRLSQMHSGSVKQPELQLDFSYEEQRHQWPTSVRTMDGGHYQIGYDKQGGLEIVLTPMEDRHRFQIYPEKDYMVTARYLPGIIRPFLVSRSSEGKVVEFLTPNSRNRALFLYSKDGHLRRLIQQSYSTLFERDSRGLPIRTTLTSEFGRMDEVIVRQGPQPVQTRSTFTSSSKISATVQFDMHYDGNLRLKSIQANLNGETSLESVQLQYNAKSGRLERLKNFSFQWTDARTRILGENFVLETITNPRNEVRHMKIIIGGRKTSEVVYKYNTFGAIVEMVDSSADVSVEYRYSESGKITEIIRNDESAWKISYDLAGRVKTLNSEEISYNDGKITKRGNESYLVGVAGETLRRDTTEFQYDAFGRLVRAREADELDIALTYDDLHRVVAREDFMRKTLMTFYYAYPDRPHLMTHYYESSSETLSTLYYDHGDRLFAMDQSDRRYFILTRPDKTPMKIFSREGSSITSFLVTSPFGASSDPDSSTVYLPIGFRGAFQERSAGFSVIGGRPLDSYSGRWMSVSLDSISDPVDPFKPWMADVFTYWDEEPTSRGVLNFGVEKWLEMCGVHVQNLLPLLDFSHPEPADLNPVSMGSLASLRSAQAGFRSLLSELPTHLVRTGPYPSSQFPQPSARTPVYGDGVVLSEVGSLAVVSYIANADKFLQEAMMTLLNETGIIDLEEFGYLRSMAVDSKTLFSRHYIWKENSDALQVELKNLGVSKDRVALTRKLNLTSLPPTEQGSAIVINSESAEVVVHYGGDFHRVALYYRRLAEKNFNEQLWAEERNRVLTNSSLAYGHPWDEAQLQELKSRGELMGWSTKPRWVEEVRSTMYHRLFSSDKKR